MRQYTRNFARATARPQAQAQPIPKPIAKPAEKKPPVQPKGNMMSRWKDSLKSISDDFATLMGGRKG